MGRWVPIGLFFFTGVGEGYGFAPIELEPLFQAEGIRFHRPTWFGDMPGRDSAYVVLEQHEGRVNLVRREKGAWVREGFYQVAVSRVGECGLLGIAFHPSFTRNRRYFLYYNPASGRLATVVEEREAAADFRKDAGRSGKLIVRVAQDHFIHQGGTLAFGRDKMLYIGLGDGGDVKPAQDRMDLRGKLLRIDVDAARPYGIPADNPFLGRPDTRPEIWALGLRNPWRWSFDPLTGELWAGDVGEMAMEEINRVPRGANLGWAHREGKGCRTEQSVCVPPADEILVEPVHEYPRAGGAAIIGGHVFRGNPASPWYGAYFFADFVSGEVQALRKAAEAPALERMVAKVPGRVSTLGTDASGALFAAGLDDGIIYRLTSPEIEPIPVQDPPKPEPDPPLWQFAAPAKPRFDRARDAAGRLNRIPNPASGILYLPPREAGSKRLPAVLFD